MALDRWLMVRDSDSVIKARRGTQPGRTPAPETGFSWVKLAETDQKWLDYLDLESTARNDGRHGAVKWNGTAAEIAPDPRLIIDVVASNLSPARDASITLTITAKNANGTTRRMNQTRAVNLGEIKASVQFVNGVGALDIVPHRLEGLVLYSNSEIKIRTEVQVRPV